MKKKTKQDDPLWQLQQEWQQHKAQVQSVPFLTDEELRELFNRVKDTLPEPLPGPVDEAVYRANRYARVRPFRYATVFCVLLLLANGVKALSPVSTALTRSVDAAVTSQYATDTVANMLNGNDTLA